jgi:hypothetical protein
MDSARTVQVNKNEYHLATSSPPWEPQVPVIVNAISDSTVVDSRYGNHESLGLGGPLLRRE